MEILLLFLPQSQCLLISATFNPEEKAMFQYPYPKVPRTATGSSLQALPCLWNAIIYTTLAVPVYSFQVAIDQKAVYIDDKTWQWTGNATLLNVTYQARLTGQITASNVVWKMYITKEGTGVTPISSGSKAHLNLMALQDSGN